MHENHWKLTILRNIVKYFYKRNCVNTELNMKTATEPLKKRTMNALTL